MSEVEEFEATFVDDKTIFSTLKMSYKLQKTQQTAASSTVTAAVPKVGGAAGPNSIFCQKHTNLFVGITE